MLNCQGIVTKLKKCKYRIGTFIKLWIAILIKSVIYWVVSGDPHNTLKLMCTMFVLLLLLLATCEDYKLLENMNKLTSLKYMEMKDISINISRNLQDLNQKCRSSAFMILNALTFYKAMLLITLFEFCCCCFWRCKLATIPRPDKPDRGTSHSAGAGCV